MNPDFEKRLQDQPMRELPGQWRARILAPAKPSPPWWREWLWPCPQAWAGLAAVWLVICVMHLAEGRNPSQHAMASVAISHQEIVELRHQQEMLAEIISPPEPAEPPEQTSPSRSELRQAVAIV
jgi:hypothetical protein